MFDRSRAYDYRANYSSRYHAMMESKEPEDKANAECCRLASQAWQDIAQYCQNPAHTDEKGNPLDFDVESVIVDIRTRWEDYCRTGVPRNEVDDLAADIRKKHAQEMANRRVPHTEFIQRMSESGQGKPVVTEKNQKNKKGQKPASDPQPADLPGQLSRPSDVEEINEENRKHIQLDAIEYVISEIYLELGVEAQEQESAFGGIQFNQV
jgi:hypothetical protein